MNKEEFATSIIPNFNERWEVYNSKPEDLIGRKVISITSGFSTTGGGQIMIIDDANEHQIHFISCEESRNVDERHLGWGCSYDERHNKFIFIDK